MTFIIHKEGEESPFLEGKVSIVTGASGDIGYSICDALLKNGANVYGVFNSRGDKLKALQKNPKFRSVKIDFMSDDYRDKISKNVSEIAKAHNGLDSLVYSAGIAKIDPFLYETKEDSRSMWRVNYEAALELSREFLRYGGRNGPKHLIYIASTSGVRGVAQEVSYSASKAALINLAKCLAEEFGSSHDICANAISPGAVPTGTLRKVIPDIQAERLIAKSVPKYRLCSIEDVTNACLGILMNNFYNGENFVLHGGRLP